jgi:hypothetical protein
MTVEFGDVVETRYVTSEEQLRRSQFGFSPVFFSGNPIVYTPGDPTGFVAHEIVWRVQQHLTRPSQLVKRFNQTFRFDPD